MNPKLPPPIDFIHLIPGFDYREPEKARRQENRLAYLHPDMIMKADAELLLTLAKIKRQAN